ncbi:MAG: glycoside hydrolase family 2 [Bacteroidales bacterium]|nr:glycoside hydrolase family 2 [Bacteroidales bacterium]
MKTILFCLFASLFTFALISETTCQQIPLPEHPRPDLQRDQWQNLNGKWDFNFDHENIGIDEGWFKGNVAFEKQIMVPFPWGSNLSGLENEADIGWYSREITVDPDWEGKRVFLTIGASDWETTVWLDGKLLGKHQGGYVPFSFELTDAVDYGKTHRLVIRVDDARREFTLYGKQGYGDARGIWQTVYLEARGRAYLDAVHFSPDIDREKISVTVWLDQPAAEEIPLEIKITTPGEPVLYRASFPEGENRIRFEIDIPDPRLWSLDDPYLYEVTATAGDDRLHTYFGMRKISVVDLPGTDHRYIALNDEPIYLQLALDQSYHPDGFYTFPSDRFMKEEILRSKSIGLNGIRTHIKVEVPRKLYWADKLGLLVMEDLPNSWGEPRRKMQEESEYTMRQMIKRDYNHPAIFSWVIFNETWGLFTNTGKDDDGNNIREYLPETQAWVASMYYLAKSLDRTRLVEDNSICCGRGHTETDINSWHSYLPGWAWDEQLQKISDNTFKGSTFHFEEGYEQGNQPNINSECGNVWGYQGSTGDIDWSWDYHRMLNSFRMFPRVAGWLYTEHHDVINEWNGYWRFDRSEKYPGFGEIFEGMTLNDLHSLVYLSTGNEICTTVKGGEFVEVPLFLSVMTGEEYGDALKLSWELELTSYLGEVVKVSSGERSIGYTPWMQEQLEPLKLEMPDARGLAVIKLKVEGGGGRVLQRNFMHFEITDGDPVEGTTAISVPAAQFSDAAWSVHQWDVLDGRKVNGAGSGYFTYEIRIPEMMKSARVKEAEFIVELSAKEFFVKDQEEYDSNRDFMRGSRVAPSANPNSYPMTDEQKYPSEIEISINGNEVMTTLLEDDPADHRGVLSWHHQLQDRRLREAGSYGYLVRVPIGKRLLGEIIEEGGMQITFRTKGEGGIAVYGKEFGRYPLDPTLVIR